MYYFSFLTIPPVTEIKDVSQLARAVESEQYHCVSDPRLGNGIQMIHSKLENLRIIGRDLMNTLLLIMQNLKGKNRVVFPFQVFLKFMNLQRNKSNIQPGPLDKKGPWVVL